MKKKTDKAPLIKATETPSRERMRQDGGITFEAIDRDSKDEVVQVRYRAKEADKIDWYYRRKVIDKGMCDAGKRMAFLLFCAGKVPTTSVMYREMVQSSRMPGDFERAINNKTWAQEKLDDALSVLDSEERDVLWTLCANDMFADTTPRKRKMITGLAKLAGAWGFGPEK